MDPPPSSLWSIEIALSAKEHLEVALERVAKSQSTSISILNLGCSQGITSAILFSQVLTSFRNNSTLAINIYHEDLPTNNWNSLSEFLASDQSYSQLGNVFHSIIPTSFYHQVLPDNSVHLAFSNSTFEYLSKDIEIPDTHNSNRKELKELASRQSIEDMKLIIQNRYNELIPGGVFVLLTNFQHSQGVKSCTGVIAEAHQALYQKNIITQEEHKRFRLPIWYRGKEEWQEILGSTSSLFKLIAYEVRQFSNPYYAIYLEDQNFNQCVENTTSYLKGLVEEPFLRSLENSDTSIFDQFLEEIASVLRKECNLVLLYTLIVLEKI